MIRVMTIVVGLMVWSCLVCPLASADLNSGIAAYNSGNYTQAFRELSPLAEQGEPKAQALVGNMYYNGEGIAKDQKEAIRWYHLAADQGHGAAAFMLGNVYRSGQGGAQANIVEALRWYRQEEEHGSNEAQYKIKDLIGQPAPEFKLQDLNGKWHALSDYRGKLVILTNFG